MDEITTISQKKYFVYNDVTYLIEKLCWYQRNGYRATRAEVDKSKKFYCNLFSVDSLLDLSTEDLIAVKSMLERRITEQQHIKCFPFAYEDLAAGTHIQGEQLFPTKPNA